MVALDAMGGDKAPTVNVLGAINAAKKGIEVGLFGDQAVLEPLLDRHNPQWRKLPLSIIHCTQTIAMTDEPARAVVKKKDASLIRAIEAVVHGCADAIVSAGHSGAALVAGTLLSRRVQGVMRPAIGTFLPTKNGQLFCIDIGANTDCKPEYFEQFALMGHLYVRTVKGINKPRIALLSNGQEPYKGSMAVKSAYALLEKNSQIDFVGSLQARDIFDDTADVLVCDGFAGNVLLKTAQGMAGAIAYWLKQEADRSILKKIMGLCSKPLFNALKRKTDYARTGGALLLGINHPVIIAHGHSDELAIERAIVYAHEVAQTKFLDSFNHELTSLIGSGTLSDPGSSSYRQLTV
jgi:glycerol-3-phosphate acyltransferase PlsX